MAIRNEEASASDDQKKLQKAIEGLAADAEASKKLLMLLLLKLGSTSDEIASALGVESSTIRKTISGSKVKKLVPLPVEVVPGEKR